MTVLASWDVDKDKSTQDPLAIRLGEGFKLQCTVKMQASPFAQNKWKVCNWSRDNDDAGCEFTYVHNETADSFTVNSECTGSMDDAVFFGSEDTQNDNFVCGMDFKEADGDDIAGWKCEIEQCDTTCKPESGNGKKAHLSINVKVSKFFVYYVFYVPSVVICYF